MRAVRETGSAMLARGFLGGVCGSLVDSLAESTNLEIIGHTEYAGNRIGRQPRHRFFQLGMYPTNIFTS